MLEGVKKATDEKSWVAIFCLNGMRIFGKIARDEMDKLGKDPVKIFYPFSVSKAKGDEYEMKLMLAVKEFNENWQYFNSAHFFIWQEVTNFVMIEELDRAMEKAKQDLSK